MKSTAIAILYMIVTSQGPTGQYNGWTSSTQFDSMEQCLVEADKMNDLPLVSATCLYEFNPLPM